MAVKGTTTPSHAILLFLTSASVLAYEILLTRLLSIGLWYHFAYMVISLALPGFGAAGSLLFLTFEKMKRNIDQWLVVLAGATAVAFPLAFSLSQKAGLDPLQLIWQKSEWIKMMLACLLMAIPFFLAGGIVGMILTAAGEGAHLMYASDLMGAGTGALAVSMVSVLAFPFRPPDDGQAFSRPRSLGMGDQWVRLGDRCRPCKMPEREHGIPCSDARCLHALPCGRSGFPIDVQGSRSLMKRGFSYC
jgi:hypothetical protein